MDKAFSELKDKKIKIFKILEIGTSIESKVTKEYLKDTQTNIQLFWAYFRNLSGSEYFKFNTDQHKVTCLFILNKHKQINESFYIEYNSQIYAIDYVDNLEDYAGDIKIFAHLIKNPIEVADNENL